MRARGACTCARAIIFKYQDYYSTVVGHSGYTKAVEVAPSSAYLVLGGRATLAALRAARGHQGGVHYLYDSKIEL